MSQRPVESHDKTNPSDNGRGITLPPVNIQPQDESQKLSRREGSSVDTATTQSMGQSGQPIPLQYSSASIFDDRPVPHASRSLDVSDILNPTEPEGTRPSPSLPATAVPALIISATAREEASSNTWPSAGAKRSLQSPSIPSSEGAKYLRPRKTILPKSPPSVSPGGGGNGVLLQSTKRKAEANAAPAYSVTLDTYADAAIPPMPTLPQHSHGYNFPFVATAPLDRRCSAGPMGPSVPHPQYTNPQASHFAHNQRSLAPQHSRSQGKYLPGPYPPGLYQTMEGQSISGLQPSQPSVKQDQGPYAPVHGGLPMPVGQHSSGAQGPQVMQLQGRRLPVPLDRVSGSRNADEKRKHNAAASSRFRERRKKLNDELNKENDDLKKENEEYEKQNKELKQRLQQTGRDLHYFRVLYERTAASGGPGTHQPSSVPPPFRGVSYGHVQVRVGPRALDEEERPAQRRRTQGPELGEAYGFPSTASYPSASGRQPNADGNRPPHGLQPARSAPGSMSAPSPMPRSPYEQYPPASNGGGYFRSQHSGPPTPASSHHSYQGLAPPPGAEHR